MDMPWIHTLTIIIAMTGLVGRLWKISYDANAKFDAEFLETRKLWASLLQKICDTDQKYNETNQKYNEANQKCNEKYNEMNQKYIEEGNEIKKEIREINRKSYIVEKQIRKLMKKL